MKSKKALFIGRFQPFHMGHLHVLRHILRDYTHVVIAVGSTQEDYTEKNPLTEKERVVMIERLFKQIGLSKSSYKVVSVPDINTNSLWPDYVARKCGKFDYAVTASPLNKLLFRDSGYRVESYPIYQRRLFSGAEIRGRMLAGKDWAMLVPASVLVFLNEIDLQNRVKKIASSDNPYIRW